MLAYFILGLVGSLQPATVQTAVGSASPAEDHTELIEMIEHRCYYCEDSLAQVDLCPVEVETPAFLIPNDPYDLYLPTV